jgi:hypothetical protein
MLRLPLTGGCDAEMPTCEDPVCENFGWTTRGKIPIQEDPIMTAYTLCSVATPATEAQSIAVLIRVLRSGTTKSKDSGCPFHYSSGFKETCSAYSRLTPSRPRSFS